MEYQLLKIAVSTYNGQKNTIQNIYFPKNPVFNYLSSGTKDNIMLNVERGTRRDKLISLANTREEVFSEIIWNYELNYNSFKVLGKEIEFPITSEYSESVRIVARNLSFLICALLMVFITVDHDQENMESKFIVYGFVTNMIIKVLCLLQLGTTLWYCYLWAKMRAKLALESYHKEEEENVGI